MQLLDATEDLDASSIIVKDVGALQEDIMDLKGKVRILKEDHSRIKSEVWFFGGPDDRDTRIALLDW